MHPVNVISRRLAPMFFLALVTNARAGDADAACHQMAIGGHAQIEMFSGPSAMCTDKKDLSLACVATVKSLGAESSENYNVRYFLAPGAPCKDAVSVHAFCQFVGSYDGYQVLLNDENAKGDPSSPDYATLRNPVPVSAKACGTTPEAMLANLCAKADAAKQWDFAYAYCPVEGKAIYVRECLKPSTTDGEGAGRVIKRSAAECAASFDRSYKPKK